MEKITRLYTYETLLETKFLPLFFNPNLEVAEKVAQACADGGARMLEFTNRGKGALEVFSSLRKFIDHEQLPLILGVGSIIEPSTAALFLAYGADFIVGPTLNTDLSRFCNKHKVAYIPGCQTANEISLAEEFGAEIVKVFPGSCIGGPEFISSILGPMPWSRILPTGGVKPEKENLYAWLKAGAAAVGMGSNLVRKDWIQSGEFDKIKELTASVAGWIKELN